MRRKYDAEGEYVPGWDARLEWLQWKLYRAWCWPLSRFGYWDAEHGFKECPTGQRWCVHVHYRFAPGRCPQCGMRKPSHKMDCSRGRS